MIQYSYYETYFCRKSTDPCSESVVYRLKPDGYFNLSPNLSLCPSRSEQTTGDVEESAVVSCVLLHSLDVLFSLVVCRLQQPVHSGIRIGDPLRAVRDRSNAFRRKQIATLHYSERTRAPCSPYLIDTCLTMIILSYTLDKQCFNNSCVVFM
ncbi:hypothetical protein Trydic_g5931 [Trypoxylus dichotomus]